MEDFASAAMIRLIRAGMRAQKLTPPELPEAAGAHVPLSSKRQIATWLLDHHGPRSILRIADAVWTMPVEPILRALIMAQDMADLFSRWTRLERVNHSSHRILARPEGDGAFYLRHVNMRGPSKPHLAETLSVIGLVTVLAERIAPEGFRMQPAGADAVWRMDGQWCAEIQTPDEPEFILHYQPALIAAPPAESAGDRRATLSDQLREIVLADPVRRWSVGDLSLACGMSRRSLQRRLARYGASMSQIIAQARMEVGADFLIRHPEKSLAEISFLCGFSDQAHFNRAFKSFTATTPGEYRKAFQASAAG